MTLKEEVFESAIKNHCQIKVANITNLYECLVYEIFLNDRRSYPANLAANMVISFLVTSYQTEQKSFTDSDPLGWMRY